MPLTRLPTLRTGSRPYQGRASGVELIARADSPFALRQQRHHRRRPTIGPMAIDWNDEIVDQLESHWQQQLRPRLDGLTDDEYFWQPVPGCWTISRRGESSAPVSVGAGEVTMDY